MNWQLGFKRIRWAFLGLSWLLFIWFHAIQDASAAMWGQNAVYMLFFTGGVVLFARLCIWIVRGFFKQAS